MYHLTWDNVKLTNHGDATDDDDEARDSQVCSGKAWRSNISGTWMGICFRTKLNSLKRKTFAVASSNSFWSRPVHGPLVGGSFRNRRVWKPVNPELRKKRVSSSDWNGCETSVNAFCNTFANDFCLCACHGSKLTMSRPILHELDTRNTSAHRYFKQHRGRTMLESSFTGTYS